MPWARRDNSHLPQPSEISGLQAVHDGVALDVPGDVLKREGPHERCHAVLTSAVVCGCWLACGNGCHDVHVLTVA